MSRIDTPASASAAVHRLGRQVDGVLVGVLAELGHVDPEDPDVVTGAHRRRSVSQSLAGSKPKPIGFDAVVVGRRASTSPGGPSCRSTTWSGSGSTLMMLPRTGVPSQSTTADTNGTGMPGAAKATIVNVVDGALGRHVRPCGIGAEARGAGVAAVEVAGPARRCTRSPRGAARRRARGSRRAGSVRSSRPTVRGTDAEATHRGRTISRRRDATGGCTTSGSAATTCPTARRSPCSAATRGAPS